MAAIGYSIYRPANYRKLVGNIYCVEYGPDQYCGQCSYFVPTISSFFVEHNLLLKRSTYPFGGWSASWFSLWGGSAGLQLEVGICWQEKASHSLIFLFAQPVVKKKMGFLISNTCQSQRWMTEVFEKEVDWDCTTTEPDRTHFTCKIVAVK